jgi:hypothetical protein
MAKGQIRGNREKKKPKQDKVKTPAAPVSPFAKPGAKPTQAAPKKK